MSARGMGLAFATALFIGVRLGAVSADFQAPTPFLPDSVKLSEVEIRLAMLGGGGGCPGRCMKYNVRVSGDGMVEFEDPGGEPRISPQSRRVPVEQVVSLVDAFVRVRFFDAASSYTGSRHARRDGEFLRFDTSGPADAVNWDLTLRLGNQTKTVRLVADFPEELGRVRDLVDTIGGPRAWSQK